MKKYTLICIGCLITLIVNANPIYLPMVYLDRFSFNEEQQWKMVLMIFTEVDSVFISSSTGIAKCKNNTNLYLEPVDITVDSLYNIVNIDPEGDLVTIISFYTDWQDAVDSITETFVYGNYPHAIIPAPSAGQSIVRILPSLYGTDYHCLSDSLDVVTGTLYGKIYDKENQPVTSGSFNISPFPVYLSCDDGSYGTNGFDVDEYGSYTTSLYSVIYQTDKIDVCSKNTGVPPCNYYTVDRIINIDSLHFTMLPGLSLEEDIYLKDDWVAFDEHKARNLNAISIFPNPVEQNCFHYEISMDNVPAQKSLQLRNTAGQLIWDRNINENTGDLVLPQRIGPGIYFLQLWIDHLPSQSILLIVERTG